MTARPVVSVDARLAEIEHALYVAAQEVEGIPYTAPEVFVARLRELLPEADWLLSQLRDARRCNAIGHPTVTPESLIPCMGERGHDGDHWSATGCTGGTVTWPTVEAQLRDARAENERLAEFCRWLIAMDDPSDEQGWRDRQTVTLARIISRAHEALAAEQDEPKRCEHGFTEAHAVIETSFAPPPHPTCPGPVSQPTKGAAE